MTVEGGGSEVAGRGSGEAVMDCNDPDEQEYADGDDKDDLELRDARSDSVDPLGSVGRADRLFKGRESIDRWGEEIEFCASVSADVGVLGMLDFTFS